MMSSRERRLGASVMTSAYCDHCGRPVSEGGHAACVAAREPEPPRHRSACRRRLVVQVTPTGWSAHCVEHGMLIS
ncbi:biotin synthase auxiliary protein BsaP [Nonomuraea muscovyensis]|uniref:biotin synthase auxiliary protein BsaP n=1 Tax=Nonomuraea muscovyensis TaxID=1124761 RepID=UPI00406BC615